MRTRASSNSGRLHAAGRRLARDIIEVRIRITGPYFTVRASQSAILRRPTGSGRPRRLPFLLKPLDEPGKSIPAQVEVRIADTRKILLRGTDWRLILGAMELTTRFVRLHSTIRNPESPDLHFAVPPREPPRSPACPDFFSIGDSRRQKLELDVAGKYTSPV